MAQIDSAYQRNILEHNKGRLISCLKLCGKCELGLHGHDESADIFEMMYEGDTRLKRHYDSVSQTFFWELMDVSMQPARTSSFYKVLFI